MAVTLPAGPPYTIDDLDRFPSDGNRYELIEGSLHVTPSPAMNHQQVVANLHLLLHDACPPPLNVLFAPLDVILGPATVLVPDVLVIPSEIEGLKRVPTAPLLVVEVLSPSTRDYDLGTKWRVYQEAGVGSYWVVDPLEPSVRVWTWDEGNASDATVTGDEALEIDWPFAVTVVPSALTHRTR